MENNNNNNNNTFPFLLRKSKNPKQKAMLVSMKSTLVNLVELLANDDEEWFEDDEFEMLKKVKKILKILEVDKTRKSKKRIINTTF